MGCGTNGNNSVEDDGTCVLVPSISVLFVFIGCVSAVLVADVVMVAGFVGMVDVDGSIIGVFDFVVVAVVDVVVVSVLSVFGLGLLVGFGLGLLVGFGLGFLVGFFVSLVFVDVGVVVVAGFVVCVVVVESVGVAVVVVDSVDVEVSIEVVSVTSSVDVNVAVSAKETVVVAEFSATVAEFVGVVFGIVSITSVVDDSSVRLDVRESILRMDVGDFSARLYEDESTLLLDERWVVAPTVNVGVVAVKSTDIVVDTVAVVAVVVRSVMVEDA
ncbi:hypothetical protein Aduo_006809 [Ancylostoma duodenale]